MGHRDRDIEPGRDSETAPRPRPQKTPKADAPAATPTGTPTTQTPKPKQEQTPQQQADRKRSDAKALRRAAFPLPDAAAKPLLDRAAALEAEAETLSPKPAKAPPKPKADPQPLCPSRKKDGTACTARCVAGKDTCVDHQPAWDRLTEDERQAIVDVCAKADPEHVAEFWVSEVGWHRARAIAAELLPAQN